MKLKSYDDFLLESFLFTSKYFEDILKNIPSRISRSLLNLINKDVKTNFNIINVSDTNDKLSFMTDPQAQRKIKTGTNPLDLFTDTNSKSTIGRIIRSILTSNEITYTDYEIETFVNRFKAEYNRIFNTTRTFKEVKGEDIRFWYLSDNYSEQTLNGKGSLGKSCMRYIECQSFLDIYVQNPQVSLIIQLEGNKLISRSLLWETDSGKLFLDRVYFTYDSDSLSLETWIKEKYPDMITRQGKHTVSLTGPTSDYENYPFMDNFAYYYIPYKKLFNYDPQKDEIISRDRKNLLYLESTEGRPTRMDMIWCEFEEEMYEESETKYSEKFRCYISDENAVWSKYHRSYIYLPNARHSDKYEDWIDSDNCRLVYLNSDETLEDYLPEYDDSFAIDQLSGDSFLKELMFRYDYVYYLIDNLEKIINKKNKSLRNVGQEVIQSYLKSKETT